MATKIQLGGLIAMMALGFGCADAPTGGEPGDDSIGSADMPLGDAPSDDVKADGTWGAALTCKPIPVLPRLISPRITISLNGLTLHLVDTASGYDRVFPIGPGAIDAVTTEPEFGESKSYYPIIATGKNDFAITPSGTTPCKTWWTDPDTGEKSPVFAGLPFMSWYGNFAIHGPIDNYRAANGGNLRRGFVSHGCIRMEAADVLEVYGRIKGLASVPVHVQREPERRANGTRVDLPSVWIGAECASDGDCNFAGGFCKHNKYSDRGFCSAHCTSGCADRAGQPTTFCVADPDSTTSGMCVPRMIAQDQDCRPYDHFVARTTTRFKSTATTVACVPGSPGWIGDHCLASADCKTGNTCSGATATHAGVCTQTCSRFCPDQPGSPWTFCAAGGCARECTPQSNASECPADSDCLPRTRGFDGKSMAVCVPR